MKWLLRWWTTGKALRRPKPNECLELGLWGCVILERGGWPPKEEAVCWICLPSWDFTYRWSHDDYAWGQRVLMFYGHSGFKMQWRFP